MKAPSLLVENDWIRVTLERDERVVRIARTDVRLTPAGLSAVRDLVPPNLPPSRRRGRSLLLDTRLAPLVASDEMEPGLGESSAQILAGFSRSAVLVRTAVGKLQAMRFSKQSDHPAPVFDDEEQAMAHLLGDEPART